MANEINNKSEKINITALTANGVSEVINMVQTNEADFGFVTSQEMLETGIKVVDLLCPYQKGGKIGLFGGAGVGKTVLIQELIQT